MTSRYTKGEKPSNRSRVCYGFGFWGELANSLASWRFNRRASRWRGLRAEYREVGWLTQYRRNSAGLVGTAVAANSWIFVSGGASSKASQGGRMARGVGEGWLKMSVVETDS